MAFNVASIAPTPAPEMVDGGGLGRIQLLRSLTRDPGPLDDPAGIPGGTIFRETLIHDFDVLRFLAGGAEPVEVYAMADALVRPDFKARGLLDTALVTLRYDSGAMATADASFEAVYGYDVRAEVFGSEGMASVGESSPINLVHHSRSGSTFPRLHWFVDLFGQAYTAELAHFAASVRGKPTSPASTRRRRSRSARPRPGRDPLRRDRPPGPRGRDRARLTARAALFGSQQTGYCGYDLTVGHVFDGLRCVTT